MTRFETGTVVSLGEVSFGVRRVGVDFGDDVQTGVVYVDLIGDVALGDEVVCNTTARQLGLGTGGEDFVHWNLTRREFQGPQTEHLMKLRYTSLQTNSAVVEQGELPDSLGSIPVGVATLHSQIAAMALALRFLDGDIRIGYVMTDAASVHAGHSKVLTQLREAGVVNTVITAGHAIGGDREAIGEAGALLALAADECDIALVGMGPGVVGTNSTVGTTAIEAASVVDLVGALGGRAVLCVRCSDADERRRHRGISHHVHAALRLRSREVMCATPAADPTAFDSYAGVSMVDIAGPEAQEVFGTLGIHVKSMGRGPAEDPVFFRACMDCAALLYREWAHTGRGGTL